MPDFVVVVVSCADPFSGDLPRAVPEALRRGAEYHGARHDVLAHTSVMRHRRHVAYAGF